MGFNNSKQLKTFFSQFILLVVSVLTGALSHPNFIYHNGFGFLAWIYYLPLLLLLKSISFKKTIFFSFLFALLFSTVYGYWLINYGILTYLVILVITILWYTGLFYLIKIVQKAFGSNDFIIIFLVICSFEFLKTRGFLGFNYGITAYSQWRYIPIIQIADITGVFGLNAIIIFPSCCIYRFVINKIELRKYELSEERNLKQFEYESHFEFLQKDELQKKKYSVKKYVISFCIYLLVFSGTIVYSFFARKDYSKYEQMKVAAIQNCDSPDKNGLDSYIENFQTLYTLSDSAMEMNQDLEIIIWPENAVVPSITFKYDYVENLKKLYGDVKITDNEIHTQFFIRRVTDYLSRQKKCTFVLGNNQMEINQDKEIEYYNAALVFNPGSVSSYPNPGIYRKNHLVPFTEGFPYKNIFPDIYNKLYDMFDYLYESGKEYNVFTHGNLKFSTPICFEDTFSDTARNMYKAGARAFFNLTNDSWAESKVSQYQHLSISIFRAVENRVPMVRSAVSGQTCIINPDGKILQMIEPFTKYFVSGYIPVINSDRKPTVYASFGYIVFEWGIVFLTLFLLIIRLIIGIIKKK